MIRVFFLSLFLVYYWYFYSSKSTSIGEPPVGSPVAASLHQFEFNSKDKNHFQFIVNQNVVWEHTLSTEDYKCQQEKIVPVDPCHEIPDNTLIPATGKALYDYLKFYPEVKDFAKFKENNKYTVQKGNVFYFKCQKGHIAELHICPSGTTLRGNTCENVDSCTGKEDGTLLAHPIRVSEYIMCLDGKEKILNCPEKEMFYHDRCEPIDDLTHYCKLFPNTSFVYDEESKIECQNEKLVFVQCKPGTQFINNSNQCQPTNCLGKPNGTKLPLPQRETPPFNFIPGYVECLHDKIETIVECPQDWDESLTNGDNLTSLPMVFDGKKCSIPSFCDNVFSDDPDVIVPIHEFTKHVKNWNFSKFMDRGVGFVCENKVRKRKILEPGKLISKRFKEEPACGPPMPNRLPIFESPNSFYDCSANNVIDCPPPNFFNGIDCVPEPTNAFKFKNFPIFKFDNLNLESWIRPFDYSHEQPRTCKDPESTFIEMYNICSHPDCSDYGFMSQIPDMEFLLPLQHQAKCKFYEQDKTIKKEPVNYKYDFWTQKIWVGEEKPCRAGQNLKTGNYIWDRTIFATCNLKQPFIFCPSTHTTKIIPTVFQTHFDRNYACEPPDTTVYDFKETDWTHFEANEIKRILPMTKDNSPKFIRINKGKPLEKIPDEGLDILEEDHINLFANQPVKLELGYRVTHPPNIAFEYADNQEINHLHSTPDHGFLVKLKNFTSKPLSFPKYTPIHFVESLTNDVMIK